MNNYKSFAVFQLQPYLDKVNINKFSQAFSRLRMSSHRLEVESGRWVKPNAVPFDERKCVVCQKLEDEYHFVLECSLTPVLRIDNQQNFKIMQILILLKSFISLFYIIRYILRSML